MTEHDHIIELLTWFVNGTLDAREQARVLQHVEQCAICRNELALQQQVRSAITQPPKIEFAPQTSFNKLWDQISDDEMSAGTRQRHKMHTVASRWFWPRQLLRNWMPITLAVELLVIFALAGIVVTDRNGSGRQPAAYRTVTDVSAIDRPIIHAVFDEATRLSDVKDILSRAGLEVVSGPTMAGVYSLTPDGSRSKSDLNETVSALRIDPRVRFAELSHP